MKFTLTIDMDNAAFEDDMELANCLKQVRSSVLVGRAMIGDSGNVRDTNGNRVGRWEITS